ncbi:MAG: gamma-glutamyl-gamma-aminobutyrate hydrolase family protein [Thermomicrobiales bacterium]
MSVRKPIIGITPSPMEDTQAHGSFRRYAAATTYTEAIEAAGGVPIVIPPQVGNIHEIISVIDGLLISGGGDIRPDRYGDDEVHDATYGIHDLRDELEIALVREATTLDIPMLCICRGIQVLNVALGGTLIQDVADQYSTEIEHRQQEHGIRKEDPSHTVSVTPGSLLARTYEADEINVNSFHHQAIRELAPDLEINGASPDEIIEGVSHPASSWILGVQWHPEMMFREHPEHLKPFAALVAEAARKSQAVAV